MLSYNVLNAYNDTESIVFIGCYTITIYLPNNARFITSTLYS